MRAVVYERYGPPEVLRLKDVAKPEPREGEVLIRVVATTVTAGDWRMRKPEPALARLYNGLFRPRKVTILGFECAGDVAAVGSGVTRFQPGDAVFAYAGFGFGCYAEFKCLPADPTPGTVELVGLVAKKPANLTYAQAAAVPTGGLTALKIVQKADIRPGQTVLVYGASGSIGTYAVQLARHLGASVTGVCSARNLELVRSLGAEEVIDYTREDVFARGETYDAVIDAVGKVPRSRRKAALKPGGAILNTDGLAKIQASDLEYLRDLAEGGELKPVIDRTYPLEQIVAAHRYVEQGHKVGNVVITVAAE